jgi:hypothetical protein
MTKTEKVVTAEQLQKSIDQLAAMSVEIRDVLSVLEESTSPHAIIALAEAQDVMLSLASTAAKLEWLKYFVDSIDCVIYACRMNKDSHWTSAMVQTALAKYYAQQLQAASSRKEDSK